MSFISAAQRIDPAEPFLTATARFSTQWLQPSTAVITVRGELDAANARDFIDYTMTRIAHTGQLVLDLGGVDFFGTATFSAVHTISVRAAGEGVDWVLVPGREVTRLLKICDPDRVLPSCNNVGAALAALKRDPRHPLLQLIPKAR